MSVIISIYRILAVLKVETDIVTSIEVRQLIFSIRFRSMILTISLGDNKGKITKFSDKYQYICTQI